MAEQFDFAEDSIDDQLVKFQSALRSQCKARYPRQTPSIKQLTALTWAIACNKDIAKLFTAIMANQHRRLDEVAAEIDELWKKVIEIFDEKCDDGKIFD